MTWIKPSFLWMAYRSGWGTKPGQERVLAIKIKRSGFEWALMHSSLSHGESRREKTMIKYKGKTTKNARGITTGNSGSVDTENDRDKTIGSITTEDSRDETTEYCRRETQLKSSRNHCTSQEENFGEKTVENPVGMTMENSKYKTTENSRHKSTKNLKGKVEDCPVRIQWDPERNLNLEQLDVRSIQIGLSGEAVWKYINEWIVGIEDVTALVKEVGKRAGCSEEFAGQLLPQERVYPLSDELARVIEATI
jgi:hypothetical protein